MTFREQDFPWATFKMTYKGPRIKALSITAPDRDGAAVFSRRVNDCFGRFML